MATKNELFGSIGERLVEIELLKRNIDCWQLAGNNPYFDLVVDVKGSLRKVQVKTANPNKKGKFNYFLKNSAGYYDYLVLVAIEENNKLMFYVIPSSVVADNTSITLGEYTKKYERFLENWDLLK